MVVHSRGFVGFVLRIVFSCVPFLLQSELGVGHRGYSFEYRTWGLQRVCFLVMVAFEIGEYYDLMMDDY
jgi:hypothetical protein